MTKAPSVLTIDVFAGVAGWREITYVDDLSPHDFDVVIWEPNAALSTVASWDSGPALNPYDSERVKELMDRRSAEFKSFIELGGDIVVFADVQIWYDLTPFEGEGYTASPWTAIPTWDLSKKASGNVATIVDDGSLGRWIRAHTDRLQYRVTFAQKTAGWKTIALTGRTREGIAAVWTHPVSGGRWILLPRMDQEFELVVRNIFDSTSVPVAPTSASTPAHEFWSSLLQAVHTSRGLQSGEPTWANDYATEAENTARMQKEFRERALRDASNELAVALEAEVRSKALKPLLFAQGRELERVVGEFLTQLGGELIEVETNRADLVVRFEDWNAVVEVKGLAGSAKESNSAQLEKWATEYVGVVQAKSVLIVNAYREMSPVERPDPFPHQMLAYAIGRGHVLVTSTQLYVMADQLEQGVITASDILTSLRDTVGVLAGFDLATRE